MTTAIRNKVFSYRQEVRLPDGRNILIRPICSLDKKALLAFHQRLSADTLFLRYQYQKGDLTDEDLKNFCDVDYENDLALVAETQEQGDKASGREIIGVGRYYRLADPQNAEVAFVVQDNEQGKGIGTHLLNHLAAIAYSKGIRNFVGEVLKTNGKMLSVFRKADPGLAYAADECSTCCVSLSVAEVLYNV